MVNFGDDTFYFLYKWDNDFSLIFYMYSGFFSEIFEKTDFTKEFLENS